MEGLIPLVYKRIKRSVSHRHYKSLSSTGGEDFYLVGIDETDHLGKYYRSPTLQDARVSGVSDNRFRRSNSAGTRIGHADERLAGFGGEYLDSDPTRRQLVRFRSHRRMFSCITG